MKSMKTNSIQLIIAGIVVVLVAICGTFAWFAVSNSANVSRLGASVESPSTEAGINSGISEIQYKVDGLWNTYDGEIPLDFVPGQSYSFKVIFKADKAQTAFLRMTGFEENTALFNLLQFRTGFAENEMSEFKKLSDTLNTLGEKPYAELLGDKGKPVAGLELQSDSTYVVYYDLELPGEEVGNEGFDLSFHAIIELIFS